MEAKILFDQLNSACEDYGIPEGNGFTFQDDLHQGNPVELEFRGFISKNGSHYTCEIPWTLDEHHNIPKQPNDYDVEKIAYRQLPFYANNERETIFCVDSEDRDGRRFWTIKICNCLETHEAKQLFERDCKEEVCLKFWISWKKENEEKAFGLWYAFEVVPQILSNKYRWFTGREFWGLDSFSKCLLPDKLTEGFHSFLQQIKATAPPSDGDSTELQE
eukprot:GHVP01025176.1.p1 GENE.GHVP01025176.1~~GHVP01025176.1.p1  ORF type:complete len:218 (+),score=37.90 GHVP01025176.1:207-860(+)